MFCFQCEQTDKGTGCTTVGNCGKTATVSREQDLLIHSLKGLSQYTSRASKLGASDPEIDHFSLEAAFSTLTNVNFDEQRFVTYLKDADRLIRKAEKLYVDACRKAGQTPEKLKGPAEWRLAHEDVARIVEQAHEAGDILDRKAQYGDDVVGMQEMIMYGLKGLMAYAEHAKHLGRENPEVYAEIRDSLAFLGDNPTAPMPRLIEEALKVGGTTLKVMEMLSNAHTNRYGHPVPTRVPTNPRPGKAILVSGHDLVDLEALLIQTEGKGIDVYSHGEILPAHGYPGLKKYKHFYGHYGGAWQLQQVRNLQRQEMRCKINTFFPAV